MTAEKRQQVVDTIARLAEDIARAAPEVADRALQIAALAREIGPEYDPIAVADIIGAETADSDLSESQVRATARAVLGTTRPPDG